MVQIHQRVPNLKHADVAQLVEHLISNQDVFGSTPNIGSMENQPARGRNCLLSRLRFTAWGSSPRFSATEDMLTAQHPALKAGTGYRLGDRHLYLPPSHTLLGSSIGRASDC